MTISG